MQRTDQRRPLSGAERRAISDNLFPLAQKAIADWDTFPWHRDQAGRITTGRSHSSQALAIDVLGTLSLLDSRQAILNCLAAQLGIGTGDQWHVELEYSLPKRLLGERVPTQLDALASSATHRIVFECKFTERAAGSCSQIQAREIAPSLRVAQCNGNFELQTNPLEGVSARCTLSGKGIKYWEWIPSIFDIDATTDLRPCPFAGSWYQWMRNMVAATALGSQAKAKVAVVVLHARSGSASKFPLERELVSTDWTVFQSLIKPTAPRILALGYDQLLELARSSASPAEGPVVESLENWVAQKISAAAQRLA